MSTAAYDVPVVTGTGNKRYEVTTFGRGAYATCGKVIAEAIRGIAGRFDAFASLPTYTFPGGTLLRYPGMVLGMLYYGLKDRL